METKPSALIEDKIISAINTVNRSLVVDFGCHSVTNLNFFKLSGKTMLSPLICAAIKGDYQMMKLLLMNLTINVDLTNEQGVTAFWIACMYGHGQVMQLLAEAGANVLVVNKRQVNVLHLAVSRDHPHIVDMLLESNFPFHLETADGMTALMLAAYHGRLEIIESFIRHLESDKFDAATKDEILNRVNSKNKERPMGALSLALLQNHQAVAIALLETGARTYYNTTPKEKDLSPIFICVQMQNKEMLEHMMNESYS